MGELFFSLKRLIMEGGETWTHDPNPMFYRRRHLFRNYKVVRWTTGKRLTNSLPKLSLIHSTALFLHRLYKRGRTQQGLFFCVYSFFSANKHTNEEQCFREFCRRMIDVDTTSSIYCTSGNRQHASNYIICTWYALTSCCAVALAQHLDQNIRLAQQSPRRWSRAAQHAKIKIGHLFSNSPQAKQKLKHLLCNSP